MAKKKAVRGRRPNPTAVDFLTSISIGPKITRRLLTRLSKNRKLFFIILFGIALIKSGIWVFPAINSSLMIARNPFVNPFFNPGDQYLMTTWLGSYLIYILGITTIAGVIWFFLTCGVFAIFVLWLIVKKHVPASQRIRSLAFITLVPATTMVFYWVGMDTLTFLLFCLFLYCSKNVYATFTIGLLLGMQHFEIGMVASISLLVYEVLRRSNFLKNEYLVGTLGLSAGLISGKFFLRWIFASHNIAVRSNRTSIGLETFRTNKEVIFHNIVPVYWSLFGAMWLVIILLTRKVDREVIALLIALTLPIGVVFFVKDQSRIMELSSFILIMQAVVLNVNQLIKLTDLQVRLVLVFWLIFPWVWFWGSTRYSVIGFDIKYVLSRLQHNNLAPWTGTITMWPFS